MVVTNEKRVNKSEESKGYESVRLQEEERKWGVKKTKNDSQPKRGRGRAVVRNKMEWA